MSERVAAFEQFVAEQRAQDAQLEVVNVIAADEPDAIAFAEALCARGWHARAERALVFVRDANEMQLADIVHVQLGVGVADV